MQEEIIRTKSIYSGRIVKLSVHDVRLPDNRETTREIIEHPGAAAIVALDDAQQVLLVRQYRIAADKILLELPAGTLEPDEDPEACAVRELQEETGYKPAQIERLGGFYVAPGYTTEFIHLFLAMQLRVSALSGDDDEFVEVVRLPFSQALALVERGEIEDAKTITGLLYA
ncbi:MAG: NUDIX hydrolase, partial [Chloroflexi bacterium]